MSQSNRLPPNVKPTHCRRSCSSSRLRHSGSWQRQGGTQSTRSQAISARSRAHGARWRRLRRRRASWKGKHRASRPLCRRATLHCSRHSRRRDNNSKCSSFGGVFCRTLWKKPLLTVDVYCTFLEGLRQDSQRCVAGNSHPTVYYSSLHPLELPESLES